MAVRITCGSPTDSARLLTHLLSKTPAPVGVTRGSSRGSREGVTPSRGPSGRGDVPWGPWDGGGVAGGAGGHAAGVVVAAVDGHDVGF